MSISSPNLFTPIAVPIDPQANIAKKAILYTGMFADHFCYLGNKKLSITPSPDRPEEYLINETQTHTLLFIKVTTVALALFLVKRCQISMTVLLTPLFVKLLYKQAYAIPFAEQTIQSMKRREQDLKVEQERLKAEEERIKAEEERIQAEKQKAEMDAKNKQDSETNPISLIRRSYQNTPELELARLKEKGILTEENEKAIDHAVNTIQYYNDAKAKKYIKVMLAQALEIKTLFSDTHHVFTHGQSANWLIISILAKKILEKRIQENMDDPEHKELARNLKNFKYLRNFSEQTSLEPTPGLPNHVLEFLNQFNSTFSERFDHDEKVRNHLLSVDAHLYNTAYAESALHFFANNYNVSDYYNKDVIKNIIQKIIKSHKPFLPDKTIEKYAGELIDAIPKSQLPCGSLFVICIPKDLSESIHYRAHPFGIPCYCDSPKENQEFLEGLQKNTVGMTSCDKKAQYRLYAPLLRPEYGVRIFRLTPLPRDQRNAMKVKVSDIVNRLYAES